MRHTRYYRTQPDTVYNVCVKTQALSKPVVLPSACKERKGQGAGQSTHTYMKYEQVMFTSQHKAPVSPSLYLSFTFSFTHTEPLRLAQYSTTCHPKVLLRLTFSAPFLKGASSKSSTSQSSAISKLPQHKTLPCLLSGCHKRAYTHDHTFWIT